MITIRAAQLFIKDNFNTECFGYENQTFETEKLRELCEKHYKLQCELDNIKEEILYHWS